MIDWSKYPNFSHAEFVCSEYGTCEVQEPLLMMLQRIRDIFDKPMIITSGYRDPSHSKERVKLQQGEHSLGLCADIAVYGLEAMELLKIALEQKVTRIGINQKGAFSNRFIHLGVGDKFFNHLPPAIWTY